MKIGDATRVNDVVLAQVIGCHPNTITNLWRRGVIKRAVDKGRRSRYDLFECVQAYIRYKENGDGNATASAAKQRTEDERHRKLKLANDELERKLVPLAEVRQTLLAAGVELTSGLKAMGSRLCNPLSRESTPQVCKKLIDDEARTLRESIAKRLTELDVADGVGSADPSAERAESGSVGRREPRAARVKRGTRSVQKRSHSVHDPDRTSVS